MQVLVIPGLLALVGVSFAVGVKLIALARRTSGFPEWALGLFFLGTGGVGYPLSATAPMAGDWQGIIAAASSVITTSSSFLLYAFTARVFYPGRTGGKVGMVFGAVVGLAYMLGYSITQVTATSAEEMLQGTMTWGGLSLVMAGGAFGWSGFAALRQWSLHRKRLALGLADPVVTNRMLLWGLMSVTVLGIIAVDTAALYSGSEFARLTIIPLATSGGGLLYGAFLTLAFFPPASYVEALRRRHGTNPGGA